MSGMLHLLLEFHRSLTFFLSPFSLCYSDLMVLFSLSSLILFSVPSFLFSVEPIH